LELAAGWNFVVKSPALLLGYIFGNKAADEAEIHKIAVAPAYRRRGLATILLDAACNYLAAHGTAACFLEVRQGNEAALHLYQKHLFLPIDSRKNYYTSPPDDAIILRKDLSPLRH
jgi:ribosomal-protein-alanine N-acetyltransferase